MQGSRGVDELRHSLAKLYIYMSSNPHLGGNPAGAMSFHGLLTLDLQSSGTAHIQSLCQEFSKPETPIPSVCDVCKLFVLKNHPKAHWWHQDDLYSPPNTWL